MIKELTNLNGTDFYNALVSGITNIISRHEHLNKINVFPVPDGDTGTNLLFTLRPIIQIDSNDISSHFGEMLSLIANTAIDSARGNSGTIMAQYFIGMLENAEQLDNLTNENMSKIFEDGFNAASSAMSDPKEGTIIAIGDGRLNHDTGDRIPFTVKQGDHVLFSSYAGTEIKIDNEDYLIMTEDDILGVIE